MLTPQYIYFLIMFLLYNIFNVALHISVTYNRTLSKCVWNRTKYPPYNCWACVGWSDA